MNLITIRGLVKKFDAQQVLNGIDLDVMAGDLKVVMGPSGCGKSTLLRCINRLTEPCAGSILFNGEDICSTDTDVRALRKKIGFVFQQFALYRHLTVLDNITLGLQKLKGMQKRLAVEKALHELGRLDMADHHSKYPSQLSGGQKQRVALARALAMEPAVILLDEPTSALDPVMSREVGDVMLKLRDEKVSMICVTHDISLANQVAGKVVFIDKGIVSAEDTIQELSQHYPDERVRQFFGYHSRQTAQ